MPDPSRFHILSTSRLQALRLLCAAALCLLLSAPMAASAAGLQDAEEEQEGPVLPFRQSVGVSPGSLLGGLGGNYEYLLGYRHGVLAEGGVALLGPGAGNWSLTAGYRLHFTPGLGGFFLGTYLRGAWAAAELPLEEDGVKTTYRMETPLVLLGANAGYRWLGERGWNVVVRGGWGHPLYSDFQWTPGEPEDEGLTAIAEALVGLDLEITIGYAF